MTPEYKATAFLSGIFVVSQCAVEIDGPIYLAALSQLPHPFQFPKK